MKHNRTKEIIACCEGIIRNAERITEDFEHNGGLEITIQFEPNEAPKVLVSKTFIPKELVDLWRSGGVVE